MTRPGPGHRHAWRASARSVPATLVLLAIGLGSAASADEGVPSGAEISFVQPGSDSVKVLVSVPRGQEVDLTTVGMTIGGTPVSTTADATDDGSSAIKRTTVLAIDSSNSMRGQRFTEAKAAAALFLDTVPDDVYVGIVSFAGDVSVAQEPTLDRDAARAVLDGLTLSQQTRLYEGVETAVEASGTEGQRNVVVLSDGRDNSGTRLSEATAAIGTSKATVDVVALEQAGDALDDLGQLAAAGKGSVLNAAPAALEKAFGAQAQNLSNQIEVTGRLPDSLDGNEADLTVTLVVDGRRYTDSAFAAVRVPGTPAADATKVVAPVLTGPTPVFDIPADVMYGAVAALGLGLIAILALLLAPEGSTPRVSIEDRITAHAAGRPSSSVGIGGSGALRYAEDDDGGLVESAKRAASKALANNQGLEAKIALRLEAAGSSLKPAEWLPLHAAIALGVALIGLLVSSGSVIVAVVMLLLGVALPWVYLGFRKGRRLRAFNAGLADTLQLMAGSLQAGLSLAQSVDTIVREGTEPIAGEFRRVLIESRLGVTLEDSLDAVGERMESKDFAWVVMAVRIQREVGGNLAELLLTVAATLREREYLRRHVKALSAEGRLSTYILGGLPPLFLVYLLLTRGDYVMVMFTDPLGWVMLGATVMLLGIGVFWMSKVSKVEV